MKHSHPDPESTPVETTPALRDRYQFGMLPLFVLTTLVASSLALIWRSERHYLFRASFSIIAVVLSVYVTLRVPYALRHLLGTSARWNRIRLERAEMERLVQSRKSHDVANRMPGDDPPQKTETNQTETHAIGTEEDRL